MTVLRESIEVDRPAREVFDYIADFSTTVEWDSTVRSAVRLDDGPLAVGSRFKVNCALPAGSIDLHYRLTGLEPDQRIELEGQSRLFDVKDIIELSPTKTGTRIDYTASFTFRRGLQSLAPAMQGSLERMGEKSLEGLRVALQDNNRPALARGDTAPRALSLLPELVKFTRAGYRRGAKQWQPVTAYMRDRHVLLTGASAGLGYATAMELARRGASLTLVMRDPAKAEKTVKEIQQATGNTRIAAEMADLSVLSEVDQLAKRLLKKGAAVDVLINNAGALFNQCEHTSEGLEKSLALLLLSPWRLTLALKPLLLKSDDARVINVVSGGMYSQKLQLKSLLQPGSDYSGAVQYARAKRGLMIATRHLAQEWSDEGIAVNAMHPGWADTPGVESSLPAFYKLMRPWLRTPAEGADTAVWLAVASEAAEISGELWLDREPRSLYLLPRTRESATERTALLNWLHDYQPPSPRQRQSAA